MSRLPRSGHRAPSNRCERQSDGTATSRASTLGWRPGSHPSLISTDLGDGSDMTIQKHPDTRSLRYLQKSTGLVLMVEAD